MRAFASCLIIVCFEMAAIAPSAAQNSQSARVEAIVAPGTAVVAMRETLDAVMKAEPEDETAGLLINFFDIAGKSEVEIHNYGPSHTADGMILVGGGPKSSWRSVLIDGHTQPIVPFNAREEEDAAYAAADPDAKPVLTMGIDLILFGGDLLLIDLAYEAARSTYGAIPQLNDLLVTYTIVKNDDRADHSWSDKGYVVFVGARPASESYTVYFKDGAVEEVYPGIMQWNGWSG